MKYNDTYKQQLCKYWNKLFSISVDPLFLFESIQILDCRKKPMQIISFGLLVRIVVVSKDKGGMASSPGILLC